MKNRWCPFGCRDLVLVILCYFQHEAHWWGRGGEVKAGDAASGHEAITRRPERIESFLCQSSQPWCTWLIWIARWPIFAGWTQLFLQPSPVGLLESSFLIVLSDIVCSSSTTWAAVASSRFATSVSWPQVPTSFWLSNINGFQSPLHPHTGLTTWSVQIVFNRGNNSEALSQRPAHAWISAAHSGHLTNPTSSLASFLSLCPSPHPYQHFLGLTPKYLLKMLVSGSDPGRTQPKTETKSLNDSRAAQESSRIKWEIKLLRCGRGLSFKIYIVQDYFSVIVCGI